MFRDYVSVCAFLLMSLGGTADVQARGWAVVWGSGEALVDVGELPSDVAAEVNLELEADVTVAFLYEYAHLFFLDVWSWDGKYVLRDGHSYWELDDTQWRELLAGGSVEQFDKPFLYQFPLFPTLVALVFAGWMVWVKLLMTEDQWLRSLLEDDRYYQAAEMMLFAEDGSVLMELDEQRLEAAKQLLERLGVGGRKAERDLRRMFSVKRAQTVGT